VRSFAQFKVQSACGRPLRAFKAPATRSKPLRGVQGSRLPLRGVESACGAGRAAIRCVIVIPFPWIESYSGQTFKPKASSQRFFEHGRNRDVSNFLTFRFELRVRSFAQFKVQSACSAF
jgi:hypothetical protein